MKTILIVGSKNIGSKNDPTAIAEALHDEASGVVTKTVYWEDILFDVKTSNVSVLFDTVDVRALRPSLVIALGWYKNGKDSIYRDVAYSFALYLRHNTITFWNEEMLSQRSVSKLSCMVQLALEDISVPDTTFSLSGNHLRDAELPFVAKAPAASRGESNYLVSTEDKRTELLGLGERFIIQPFLPNDHDLRVVCIGGKPGLVLKRYRQDETTHLNNTSKGGGAETVPLSRVDKDILTKTQLICHTMKREMAGVDFIPDKKSAFGYSCLEVNAIPQLTSGSNVATKMEVFKKITQEMITE